MEILYAYAVAFLMGFLVKHLLFTSDGKFDAMIFSQLKLGKSVIISVDQDAFIFEMKNDRLVVTQVIAQLLPVEGDLSELQHLSLVSSNADQPNVGDNIDPSDQKGNG